VARRCACGLPQVIETDPRLEDGTPFPTLWWLTCRRLGSAVGGLEAGGFLARLNERLAADPAMSSELARSTDGYLRRRDALDPLGASKHPGGGPERVKCLHAHVAHHLVTGDNPVGAATLEALSWTDPTEPCAQGRSASGGSP
jgi:hypothetical protein